MRGHGRHSRGRRCWGGRRDAQGVADGVGCPTSTANGFLHVSATAHRHVRRFCLCKSPGLHNLDIHSSGSERVHLHPGNNSQCPALFGRHHLGFISPCWAPSSPDQRGGDLHCSDNEQRQCDGSQLGVEHGIDGALLFTVPQLGLCGCKPAAGVRHRHCAGAGGNRGFKPDIIKSAPFAVTSDSPPKPASSISTTIAAPAQSTATSASRTASAIATVATPAQPATVAAPAQSTAAEPSPSWASAPEPAAVAAANLAV